MLSGSLSRSAFESNGMSGAADCATSDAPNASAPAATMTRAARRGRREWLLVIASLLFAARSHRLRAKDDLLCAPARDLRHVQLVGVATVDAVHGAELFQRLPPLAELADDAAVELHLVDLAGDRRRSRVAVVRH